MQTTREISGNSEDEIWAQISADLLKELDMLQYRAQINHSGRLVYLDIDIDLGGGFESGYATTTLIAPFKNLSQFRFAIHREDFLDEIGKFFGMQDVQIGYPEFDNRVLVKSNDEAKVIALFSDPPSRQVFQELQDYTFEIENTGSLQSPETSQLKLIIEEGMTVPEKLRPVYQAFYHVLQKLERDLKVTAPE